MVIYIINQQNQRKMKKLLFVAVLVFGCSALMAQTNFRNITYKEAVAAAKAENKREYIDFYTTR